MIEQPSDLRTSFKAVSRHRWLVILLAVAGLGTGIAYGLKTPPKPEARSLVLLPPSAITGSSGKSPYTQTQEIIATSARVLSAAGSSVLPPVSAASLKDDVTVTAPSQDILQVAVRAETMAQAERLADAVATNYIAYVAGTANGSEQLLAQLQREAAKLTQQILGLQTQINAAQSRLGTEGTKSAAGRRDSSLLNSLRTEQEQLSIQLDNLNGQLANAEVTISQGTSATQLLEGAEPIGTSMTRVPLIGLLGFLAGLLAGTVAALGLARGDRRLRSRDAIASAIGVPVVASMWATHCKKVGDWRRLIEQSTSPSPLEAWNARRVFHRLVARGQVPEVKLRLLVFPGDGTAAAAAVKVVGAAAALGMNAQLEVGAHPALTPLRAACAVTRGPAQGDAVVSVSASTTVSGELAGLTASVSLEALHSARAEDRSTCVPTLLVVSTGFATSAELAKAALTAGEAGSPVAGVVVTNPDPDDSTAGLLPDQAELLAPLRRSLNGKVAHELAGQETN